MKKIGFVLAVTGFIFFCFTEGWGEEWKLYAMTIYASYFYDISHLDHPSKDVVQVWTKRVYTDQGRIGFVAKFGVEYTALAYSLVLGEIHCVDKKSRALSTAHYSGNGEALSLPKLDSTWDSIAPNSPTDGLRKEVCK